MPRGRQQNADDGPTDADLAEFMGMLDGQLSTRMAFPLQEGSLGRLVEGVTEKGYACRVASVQGGRARAFTLYLSGERKVEVQESDPETFEEKLRGLILAVEKLPPRRG
jgi:hypothetical protein